MKKKNKIILSAVLVISVILFYFIPFRFQPPADIRVIIERTHEVYIAPACFDQFDATNNIAETSLEYAQNQGYPPESACTEEALQPVSMTLWQRVQESLGTSSIHWYD